MTAIMLVHALVTCWLPNTFQLNMRDSATTPFRKRSTPITKRMAEYMLVRNRAERTIDSYTYHVERFAKHFGKLPEDLGPEQVALPRRLEQHPPQRVPTAMQIAQPDSQTRRS